MANLLLLWLPRCLLKTIMEALQFRTELIINLLQLKLQPQLLQPKTMLNLQLPQVITPVSVTNHQVLVAMMELSHHPEADVPPLSFQSKLSNKIYMEGLKCLEAREVGNQPITWELLKVSVRLLPSR